MLTKIQAELKAPKSNTNEFGKYKYRSCEDILEAVKPLLDKYNYTLVITDSIKVYANRVYVVATATLTGPVTEGVGECFTIKAFAREAESKKGMDEAQITGAASSYARKYALNGLFLIDDTKDADTQDNTEPADIAQIKSDMRDLMKQKKLFQDEIDGFTLAVKSQNWDDCRHWKDHVESRLFEDAQQPPTDQP